MSLLHATCNPNVPASSFVVHNQPRNLIPTLKSVNSKKSDLPSLTYFDAFISAQNDVLTGRWILLKQKFGKNLQVVDEIIWLQSGRKFAMPKLRQI
jgi:hypothetical protein